MAWGGGDFASYVWNGQNLLAGRPLGEAPFIPNYETNTGVTVVPPVFPLALSAPIALFGSDLELLKVYNVCILLVFLALAYRFAVANAPSIALPFLLALAASPQLWAMRDALMSEYLFLAFILAALLAWDRLYRVDSDESRPDWFWLALTSLCVCAAILTRVVGIALLPAVFCAGVWAERRLSRKTITITLLAACAFAFLVLVIGIFEQYAPSFEKAAVDGSQSMQNIEDSVGLGELAAQAVRDLPSRLRFMISQTSALWTQMITWDSDMAKGWPGQYQQLVTALLFLFGALGFLARSLQRLTLAEWFTAGYTAMMALVPAYLSAGRMYLPVAIMLVFYAFFFVEFATRRLLQRPPVLASSALLLLILFSDALSFSAYAGSTSVDYRSSDAEAVEFFAEVRRIVPEDAVMVGYRPRGVAFFTDRTSTDYHHDSSAPAFWGWVEAIGAGYMYFDAADQHLDRFIEVSDDPADNVRRYARIFIGENEERFQLRFENERFLLYELQ
jgi:lysylphosphatidylglycerol synthetase-like protein (DUF2156 family)